MTAEFTNYDLESYLDESLDVRDMAAIETALREDRRLLAKLAEIQSRRECGAHSVAAIWRRHRLSCPRRDDLGNLLLDTLDAEQRDYIFFHITEVGCRMCQANLQDLQNQQKQTDPTSHHRRRRYFQSSASLLPNHPEDRE
jgi:hypothetical protein